MIITIIIAAWLICAFLAYGIVFAHFQGKWPNQAKENRKADIEVSATVALLGPIGLIVALILADFPKHGFRIK